MFIYWTIWIYRVAADESSLPYPVAYWPLTADYQYREITSRSPDLMPIPADAVHFSVTGPYGDDNGKICHWILSHLSLYWIEILMAFMHTSQPTREMSIYTRLKHFLLLYTHIFHMISNLCTLAHLIFWY